MAQRKTWDPERMKAVIEVMWNKKIGSYKASRVFNVLQTTLERYANPLTLNLLTTTIYAPPSNASKWQMGFNSAFKRLNAELNPICHLLALLGGATIVVISRLRVKDG